MVSWCWCCSGATASVFCSTGVTLPASHATPAPSRHWRRCAADSARSMSRRSRGSSCPSRSCRPAFGSTVWASSARRYSASICTSPSLFVAWSWSFSQPRADRGPWSRAISYRLSCLCPSPWWRPLPPCDWPVGSTPLLPPCPRHIGSLCVPPRDLDRGGSSPWCWKRFSTSMDCTVPLATCAP